MVDKAYEALFPGDDDAALPVVATCRCCFDRPAPEPESKRDREPLRHSPRRLTAFIKNRSKR